MRYQFATVELRWTGQGGKVDDLPALLRKEGLFTSAQEVFWVVSFGADTDLHSVVEVARGNYRSVEVSIPLLLSALWASGTDRFWLMHNHPSGNVKPTAKDIAMSKHIMAIANLGHLYLEDHLIIGPPNRIYSMKEHGQLKPARQIQEVRVAANSPVWVHKEPR